MGFFHLYLFKGSFGIFRWLVSCQIRNNNFAERCFPISILSWYQNEKWRYNILNYLVWFDRQLQGVYSYLFYELFFHFLRLLIRIGGQRHLHGFKLDHMVWENNTCFEIYRTMHFGFYISILYSFSNLKSYHGVSRWKGQMARNLFTSYLCTQHYFWKTCTCLFTLTTKVFLMFYMYTVWHHLSSLLGHSFQTLYSTYFYDPNL